MILGGTITDVDIYIKLVLDEDGAPSEIRVFYDGRPTDWDAVLEKVSHHYGAPLELVGAPRGGAHGWKIHDVQEPKR